MRSIHGFMMVLALGVGVLHADEGGPEGADPAVREELDRLKREREALDARIRALEERAGVTSPAAARPVPAPAAAVPAPAPAFPRRPDGVVVVTDTRLELTQGASGRSMTVIPEAELQAAGKREAQEALREVPGLHVVRTGTRGGTTNLFTRGGETDHTSVMLDGIRVNKDGGSFDFESLGLDEISQVEVVRGAGSALYGSDALAGVVNLRTRRGEGPPTMRTSFEYGTFQTTRERVSIAGGDDRFGYRVGGSNLQQRGTVFSNSDVDNRNFAGRFDVQLTPEAALTVHARTLESHAQIYTTSAGQDFDPIDPNDYKDRADALIAVSLTSQASPVWRSTFNLSRYTNQVKTSLLKHPGEVGEFSEYYSNTSFARQGGGWQNDWTLPHGHVLTAGVDYEEERYGSVSTSIASTADSTTQTDRSRTDTAIFVQDVWTWAEQLTATVGLRRNDNSDFGGENTGQAAVSWQTAKRGPRLHASTGKGIKIPTFFEIHGDIYTTGLKGTGFGVSVEKSRTRDIGVEQKLGWVTADATWFEHRYEDLVEYVGGFVMGSYQQGGNAVARGWEFAATADPDPAWRFRGDMTVMDTQVLSTRTTGVSFKPGEELIRRPHLAGNLSATWMPSPTLSGRLAMRYVGSVVDLDFNASSSGRRRRLGSYTLFDFSGAWEFLPRWRVFGTAENLLDHQYEEAFGFPSPGFNMLGGVEYRHEF